jgi:DNA-directed RNA polymerase subunit M
MVEFCPKCSNLLRKKRVNGKTYLACKCGYRKENETDTDQIKKTIQDKKNALNENLIVVTDEDKISIHPKIIKICPKCGYKEAETWQTQTRSADEPSTSFFRCVKCKFTWREY